TPEEYRALKASIERHGAVEPVIVDECGNIIAGRTRRRICEESGIEFPTITIKGLSARQRQELALELDTCRKHFGRKQRRRIVESLLRRMPRESDRSIARLAGTTPKTVRKYRTSLSAGGDIPRLTERKGRDGKTYRLPRVVSSSQREHELAL